MQQGKPLGLAKNARGGICPAGRERTFGGMPTGQAASEVTTKILPHACICPAGRDCTFGGMPVGQAASEFTAFF